MIAFILLQVSIVPQQLIETAAERKKYQSINEEELDDVNDHSTQAHLKRSKVRIN